MGPIQETAEAPSSISSTMTEAKDQLWAFQLRKENKAILQEIRDLQEQRQHDHAEFQRSHKVAADQLAAADARLIELERKFKEDSQVQEKFREEIAALQSLMADNMARKYPKDEVRFILEGGSNPLFSVPNAASHSSQSEKRPTNSRHERNARVADRRPLRGDDNSNQRPPSGSIRRPHVQTGPCEPSRHATRSRTRIEPPTSSKFIDAVSIPGGAAASRIPQFDQGSQSMKDYHTEANAVYQSLQTVESNTRFDVDFISAFLRGLRVEKTRDKLVDELRQFHPSRVMKDRWVELLCKWEDVEDAIHRARMFVEAEKMASKRQGRIMNPRAMGETEV